MVARLIGRDILVGRYHRHAGRADLDRHLALPSQWFDDVNAALQRRHPRPLAQHQIARPEAKLDRRAAR